MICCHIFMCALVKWFIGIRTGTHFGLNTEQFTYTLINNPYKLTYSKFGKDSQAYDYMALDSVAIEFCTF
jgi:hypothetical protein